MLESFWSDCILHAIYIINRLSSVALQRRIAYQIVFSNLPQFQHPMVFGYLAYAVAHGGYRIKFSPMARRSVLFLRYVTGTKGYKLYDVLTKEVFI